MAHFNIIVGSVLGASEYVADALKETLENNSHSASIYLQPDFNDILSENKQAIWLICTSTHGAGDLPDNIQPFADELKSAKLENTCFIVVGLGDSSYDTYCFGAMKMQDLMEKASAKLLADPIHIDVLTHPIPEDTAVEWLNEKLSSMTIQNG